MFIFSENIFSKRVHVATVTLQDQRNVTTNWYMQQSLCWKSSLNFEKLTANDESSYTKTMRVHTQMKYLSVTSRRMKEETKKESNLQILMK